MSAAKKLKYQEPEFMAVRRDRNSNEELNLSKKKWRIDSTVLITWIAFFALAFVFWMLIVKLF